MNRRGVAFRLMALYCGALLLAGIVFSVFTTASFRLYTFKTLENVISTRAHDVWSVTQGSLGDQAELTELIERRFSPAAENRFIRVRIDGRPIYRSGMPADKSFDPGAIPVPGQASLPRTFQFGDVLIYETRFVAPDGRSVTIESGQSDAFFRGLNDSLVTSLLIGLPLLLIIAAAGGYVLIRRALSPVELMIGAAEDITFNDPRNRLPLLGTGDRIEALGQALNRMLDRLDNAYQHANRFSADAAHELRTPLSIIRAGLELAVTTHELPQRSREYLADLLDEVTRLSHMTDNLMTLTRMDTIWGKGAHAEIDLLALAAETAEQMSLIAEERGVRLNSPTGVAAVVLGDRDRLKQALVNILDNAINYNRPAGMISLHVEITDNMAVMEVSDSGVGIAPESQEYIFDRFYRVAAGRGDTGAGLGLAIVRSICNAHGGSVDMHSRLGEGSTFFLRLPLHGF